jgi:hypothetical protein
MSSVAEKQRLFLITKSLFFTGSVFLAYGAKEHASCNISDLKHIGRQRYTTAADKLVKLKYCKKNMSSTIRRMK